MQKTVTQTQWKFPFIVLYFGLILGLGYFISVILRNEESSIPNTSVISSETRNPASASVILTKEESALAHSGTMKELPPCNLVNPFSGAIDCKKEEKPKFHKPNTEWKTRTLNINGQWLTYEFGKGNPAGAEPLSDEEKVVYKKCYYNTVVNTLDCPPPPGTFAMTEGYVTPDIEKNLRNLITDPNWEKVLTNCEQQFRQYQDISGTSNTDFPGFVTYDTMLDGRALSPENLMGIDDSTGRKRLNLVLKDWLRTAILAGVKNDGSVNLETINNCITQNGGIELYRAMDNLNQKSYYPD